jgi:hypothetical protein
MRKGNQQLSLQKVTIMQNSLKSFKSHIYFWGTILLIDIVSFFVYDMQFDNWLIERKNIYGIPKLIGWGLIMIYFVFFGMFWKYWIKQDNLSFEGERNKLSNIAIKREKDKYIIISIIEMLMIAFFFISRTFFGLWDWNANIKNVPFIVTQIGSIYMSFIIFVGYLVWHSNARYSDLIKQNKEI